jgi:chorismate dehydratase
MTVRVGHIEFLNCFPLYYGLQQRGVMAGDRPLERPGRPNVEFLSGVPTRLNQMLADGDIDFGPISSIAYARNHKRLLLSRHVSISSLGAVESIQLVARAPLAQVRRVALTGQSATAVALLKTILKLRFQQEVEYQPLGGSLEVALKTCDAVLLIGDDALTAFHSPLPGVTCYDVGRLWQEWTDLPMVYAVWAAREDFALAYGKEIRAVEAELVACMDYGREHLPKVVESAAGQFPFDRDALTRYFSLLRYDFTREYQQGLRRFFELAHQAGELDEVPEFRFIDEFAGGGMAAVLEGADPGAAVPCDEPDVGAAGWATKPEGAA